MRSILTTAAVAAALASSACAAPEAGSAAPPEPLLQTVLRLDAAVFDAFNRCSDPEQLALHAAYFAPGVEFYHDTGGVTWNRADMLANTKQNACGRYTRELVPGSVAAYPIKGFGAIEQGVHRFCQTASGQCDGLADFVIVWQQTTTGWQITRVLSYGHRAAAGQH